MKYLAILASAFLAVPAGAGAAVTASSATGFLSHNEVLVDAPPARAWAELMMPAGWWNAEHTYSGDSANMTLNPVVGGCFCEAIPGKGGPDGQIEHMRVIYLAPESTLRLTGALGPLQQDAVVGVLTVTLVPEGKMTRISWDYAVSGFLRTRMAEMAPVVDSVVGEQLLRLGTRLGRVMDAPARRL